MREAPILGFKRKEDSIQQSRNNTKWPRGKSKEACRKSMTLISGMLFSKGRHIPFTGGEAVNYGTVT
jgi:hypothetical protein